MTQSATSKSRFVEPELPPQIEPVAPEYFPPAPRPDASTEWLWILWERRRFLIRVAVWGLITSTVIAFLIPKRYESTASLMPPDSQSGSGMAMMAALAGKTGLGLGPLAGDLLGLHNSGALFTEILHSRTVEDRLIDRFNLRKIYGEKYEQDARKDLLKFTDVSEDRKSGVITITVTDRDPRRAAELAQAYVDELDRLVAEVSTSSARRERIFIEQRLQTVKQALDSASQQFSEYASKNAAIDITSQAKATVEEAATLEGQLIAAQSEMEGLEQIYSKNNVRVRSLEARIAELRAQLHKIGGDTPSDAAPGTPSSGTELPSIRQLPILGVKWADLYRETKTQETVYELLTQQYELAKIEEAKEIPVVKVLDPPNVPEKKSFPHRLYLMVLGLMLSTACACVWVLGQEVWRQIDPSDSRKQLLQEVAQRFRTLYASVVSNSRKVQQKAESITEV